MGVDIATYRARIGCFSTNKHMAKGAAIFSVKVNKAGLDTIMGVGFLLCIISTLLLIGGIEINPGPPITRNMLSNDWKQEIIALRQEMDNFRIENKQLKRKVEFLESRSKENNIIIHGVNESADQNVIDEVQKVINEKLNVIVDKGDIELAHRLGRLRRQSENSEQTEDVNKRPILCKFKSNNTKMEVMNKVKEIVSKKTTRKSLKDIKFAPDLIERVRLERKALIPHMIQR